MADLMDWMSKLVSPRLADDVDPVVLAVLPSSTRRRDGKETRSTSHAAESFHGSTCPIRKGLESSSSASNAFPEEEGKPIASGRVIDQFVSIRRFSSGPVAIVAFALEAGLTIDENNALLPPAVRVLDRCGDNPRAARRPAAFPKCRRVPRGDVPFPCLYSWPGPSGSGPKSLGSFFARLVEGLGKEVCPPFDDPSRFVSVLVLLGADNNEACVAPFAECADRLPVDDPKGLQTRFGACENDDAADSGDCTESFPFRFTSAWNLCFEKPSNAAGDNDDAAAAAAAAALSCG
jgi:hypothetical protein